MKEEEEEEMKKDAISVKLDTPPFLGLNSWTVVSLAALSIYKILWLLLEVELLIAKRLVYP